MDLVIPPRIQGHTAGVIPHCVQVNHAQPRGSGAGGAPGQAAAGGAPILPQPRPVEPGSPLWVAQVFTAMMHPGQATPGAADLAAAGAGAAQDLPLPPPPHARLGMASSASLRKALDVLWAAVAPEVEAAAAVVAEEARLREEEAAAAAKKKVSSASTTCCHLATAMRDTVLLVRRPTALSTVHCPHLLPACPSALDRQQLRRPR